MKIVFVNGSPKGKDSVTQKIIDHLVPFCKGHQYGVLNVSDDYSRSDMIRIMDMADSIVIVSPVHMGSVPSGLLGFLSDMEMHINERKALVSAVIHGDLFDSDDSLNAISVIERWAEKTGVSFVSGLGIGGSDALNYDDAGFGNRHLKTALENIMKTVIHGIGADPVCVSVGNRLLYRRNMESRYHQAMETNGITPDTLNKKISKLFGN